MMDRRSESHSESNTDEDIFESKPKKTDGEVLGRWKRVSTKGLAELKRDVGPFLVPGPNEGNTDTANLVFSKTPSGEWAQLLDTNCGKTNFPCNGKPFQFTQYRGKPFLSTIEIEGNKLTEVQTYDRENIKVVRVFDGDTMKTKITGEGSKKEAFEEWIRVK